MATKRKANAKPTKTAKKRLPGASPISGTPPPVEAQFKPGNKAAVGHGRPRTIGQLRELIQELANEETPAGLTRLEIMLRGMLASKNASDKEHLLAYGWGKVPQATQERTWEDDVVDLLMDGKINEEQLRLELPTNAERIITLANLRRGEGQRVEGTGPHPPGTPGVDDEVPPAP